MIFHNGICGKACEPWLLWDGIAKVLQSIQPDSRSPLQGRRPAASRLEESGLLSTPPTSQAAHHHRSLRGRLDMAIQLFWLTIQCVMTLWIVLRASVLTLMQAQSIPSRARRVSRRSKTVENDDVRRSPTPELDKQPIISMNLWGLFSQLLLLDRRMPWFTGMLSLLQWAALHGPGQLCRTNSKLDR